MIARFSPLLLATLISSGVAQEAPPEAAPPAQAETAPTPAPAKAPSMTNQRLAAIITKLDPEAQGRSGAWQFTIAGETVMCITSEEADRMRLISAAAPIDEITPTQLIACMQANYHSALDGRYCIGEDAVIAAFLHPLAELSEDLFISALAQVVSLKKTFGTTYTGGTFQFGSPGGTPPSKAKEEAEGSVI